MFLWGRQEAADYTALKMKVKSGLKSAGEVPSTRLVTEAMVVYNIAQRGCKG